MNCSIINPVLSLLMKHLVIGLQFVTTRVVHLPKMAETSLIAEADLITESDQAVRAMHTAIAGFSTVITSFYLPHVNHSMCVCLTSPAYDVK